jgi:HSP20 family protein
MRGTRKGVSNFGAELAYLQREVSQLFDRLSQFEDGRENDGQWRPSLDVFECKDALTVVVEVAGLPPEALCVILRRDALVITGERRSARKSGVDSFLCMERPHGRFKRELRLDAPVDVRKAQARLGRGLLTITLPRLKDRRGQENNIPVRREEEP